MVKVAIKIGPLFACILSAALLNGCYSEGNSRSLASGEPEFFLTMSRCEKEAIAKHANGLPKYSGYECRGKFLWFTTEIRNYYEGKLVSTRRD